MRLSKTIRKSSCKNTQNWNAKTNWLSFLICFLIVHFTDHAALAQTYLGFEYEGTTTVKIGNDTLKNAWAGGINFGQPSSLDFDYDGDLDLIIFDRSGDEFSLFEQVLVNGQATYQYVSNSYQLFPSDARYRCAFVDYNNDGENDLFTYGIGGIKVYKNTGNAGVGLQWSLEKAIVMTNYLGDVTNLYVSSSDIPAYADVEGDGDLDVLTFHIGGERVEYHQNQSMELYGIPDSLVFELKNECWGRFREDPNNNNVFLNDTQNPCGNGNIPNPELGQNDQLNKKIPANSAPKHSGSTLLALDMNNNGVLDLVLGDVSYPNLTLLMNGGSTPNTNSAFVSQDHNFPSNTTPASTQLFPASFYLDVNFDGVNDLIVAPNARTVSQNQRSLLYYENLGTNSNPNFSYRTDAFLQEEMIDNGLGSIPVIFDQNGDGKRDLLVANFFRYKPTLNKESCFLVYRNTGATNAPVYSYLTDDFLNLTNLSYGLRSIPTFGDLDGDGDDDLLIGKEDGTIIKYSNTAGAGNPVNFTNPTVLLDQQGIAINVIAYAAPQLFDIDKDGMLDLVIGKKTGEISYYKNTGTSTNAQFSLIDQNIGNVDVSTTPDGFAIPHFFRVNDTTHLFIGAYDGQLHYYNGIDGKLNVDSTFHLVSDRFLDLDVGLYSAFWVEDIDNDGLLNLFVGQDLGGLNLLEANPLNEASINELTDFNHHFYVFPNPVKTTLQLANWENEPIDYSKIEIIDLLGQRVQASVSSEGIDVGHLVKGAYFLIYQTDNRFISLTFIKE